MMKQLLEILYCSRKHLSEGLFKNSSDPGSVPSEWHAYFDKYSVKRSDERSQDVPHQPVIESFIRLAKEKSQRRDWSAAQEISPEQRSLTTERKQIAVLQMINAYRFLGVRHADLDPLKRQEKPHIPELDPAFYGLTGG